MIAPVRLLIPALSEHPGPADTRIACSGALGRLDGLATPMLLQFGTKAAPRPALRKTRTSTDALGTLVPGAGSAPHRRLEKTAQRAGQETIAMNMTTGRPTPSAQLRTTVRSGPPRRVVLAGELDILTAGRLEDLLTEIAEAGSPRVEIDARDLTFCDATGLQALVAADEIAVRRGGGLTLTGASPLLRRILRITGLDRRFPVGERTGSGRPA
ncbi:hypothetical protein GCM10009527_027850 [Actinomadura nitritigenes]